MPTERESTPTTAAAAPEKMTLAERIAALFTGNSLRINILRDENIELKAKLAATQQELADVEKAVEKAAQETVAHAVTSKKKSR